MPIQLLNEQQYESALEQCYFLMQKDIEPGSAEERAFEEIVSLLEQYESLHHSIDSPSESDAEKPTQ
jgi:antitoxin component HigA of HigAB toxin-antitoxin module